MEEKKHTKGPNDTSHVVWACFGDVDVSVLVVGVVFSDVGVGEQVTWQHVLVIAVHGNVNQA